MATFSLCSGMGHYIFDWKIYWAITKKILLEMKARQTFSQASRAKDTQILTRPNPETHLAQKDCSTPRKNIIYDKLYT